MAEMSPLMRVVVTLSALTAYVVGLVLLIVCVVFILHWQEDFTNGDYGLLAFMLVLAACASFVARRLRRLLN